MRRTYGERDGAPGPDLRLLSSDGGAPEPDVKCICRRTSVSISCSTPHRFKKRTFELGQVVGTEIDNRRNGAAGDDEVVYLANSFKERGDILGVLEIDDVSADAPLQQLRLQRGLCGQTCDRCVDLRLRGRGDEDVLCEVEQGGLGYSVPYSRRAADDYNPLAFEGSHLYTMSLGEGRVRGGWGR